MTFKNSYLNFVNPLFLFVFIRQAVGILWPTTGKTADPCNLFPQWFDLRDKNMYQNSIFISFLHAATAVSVVSIQTPLKMKKKGNRSGRTLLPIQINHTEKIFTAAWLLCSAFFGSVNRIVAPVINS
jgi:hypothetical protein